MKKTFGTLIAVIVISALVVCSVAFGSVGLTEEQYSTLKILIAVCVFSSAYCFVVGELAQNFSQMDKLWSLLPIVYTWIIAVNSGFELRPVVYALIVTAWGIRLTVNFARKGAYRLKFWTGEEDYRWAIVRNTPFFKARFAWTLFDLFFISVYQNALVLAICLPDLACMGNNAPFGAIDFAAAFLALFFLALETVADEYQWSFFEKKKELLKEGKTLDELDMPFGLGFNTTGIWAYMRHPNYLGEQGIWLSLYLFAVGAGAYGKYFFHWSLIGPLLLVLLFIGSSTLGESISSKKYPKYKNYAGQVFKYLPVRKFDPEK